MCEKRKNPKDVFRDVRKKNNVSFAGGVLEKPLAQPPAPSAEEIDKVISDHKNKQRNETYGTIEISLRGTVPIEKEERPYYGCRIHNQIWGCFKSLGRSGKKRFEVRS